MLHCKRCALHFIVAGKEWKLHKLYLCQVITLIISFTHTYTFTHCCALLSELQLVELLCKYVQWKLERIQRVSSHFEHS